MRQIIYTMHFKGRASRVNSTKLRAIGSATSSVVSTVIRETGVETEVKSSDGDLAFLDSALRVTGPDSFEEDGVITFGDDTRHALYFSTLGQGHFATTVAPGTMAGTASWKVDGGAGQFAAARGMINSTFTLSDTGELSDLLSGLIFLPE